MDALCMVGKQSPTTVSELHARNRQPRSRNFLLKETKKTTGKLGPAHSN